MEEELSQEEKVQHSINAVTQNDEFLLQLDGSGDNDNDDLDRGALKKSISFKYPSRWKKVEVKPKEFGNKEDDEKTTTYNEDDEKKQRVATVESGGRLEIPTHENENVTNSQSKYVCVCALRELKRFFYVFNLILLYLIV